ncbi:TniQ family protein [Rhizobium sp. B230/85]|uniref:TniQ family protein n=1 Tax=unclassified Rhizobium TaxID=2613769 RepID=UPI001AD9C55F|nr:MULTISPECIES: TniQ family protein [unclassified Rhizobium]MBO9133569.1 TniQ family protein [Rhizobium sp. B209b/85]QXZ97268.1 TniQ family protein [Rhizobium sp. B230/85]
MTIAFDIRTTPFSRWTIENERDEPGHGYFARLVAAEGHSSVTRYSDGIDVDTRNMNPERLMEIILKLPLSEERKLRLRNATPVRKDDGVWLAGQRFNHANLSFSSRRWCPGCLHESAHHRAWWDIIAIADCPYHRHPLLDLDLHGEPVRWWWPIMNMSPRGQMLAAPFPRANDTETFAGYIIGRLGFDRRFEAPILDQSDIGTVIDLCHLVGRLLASSSLSDVPPDDWKFVEAGFQALSGDAVALVEAVRAWIRLAVPQEVRTKGYGFVFRWIVERKWGLLDLRLTDMLQKVLRKALALEAREFSGPLTSDAFLDEEVSLAALAHRMGVARNGVATVADMLGFLPKREKYRGLVMFDPSEADAIEAFWHKTIHRRQAAPLLGLTPPEIKALVDAGNLREFSSLGVADDEGFRYLRSDVNEVLNRLAALCKDGPSAHRTGFRHYAKDHKLRRGDLAVSILKGELEIVVADPAKIGFEGLAIICEPIKSTRRPLRKLQRSKTMMSVGEAEVELSVTRETMLRLLDGRHLKEGKGDGAARWLSKTSVMAFAAKYRNASTFLRSLNVSLDEMIAVMAASGFKPLLPRRPKAEARSVNTIYRYEDIALAFGLNADPTQIDDPEFWRLWEKVRALGGNMPPYLQFPSQLPVDGQIVSNAGNNVAFFVSFEPEDRVLKFEGRRRASELGTVTLMVCDIEPSLSCLEEALVSLIEMTPRRR